LQSAASLLTQSAPLLSQVPGATALQFRYATTPSQIFDTANHNGNGLAIVGGLRGAIGDDWAAEMIGLLEKASPTSLWVTAAMINVGAQSGIDECFDPALHAAQQITATNDFLEGVRAVLVDKDRNPSFDPAAIDDVDPAVVARIVGA
jgi:enoyl-CoA hydratase